MSRREESEPLLFQPDYDNQSHGESEVENHNLRISRQGQRDTVGISLAKPTAAHDYSITGEHYDPISQRSVEYPTSNAETMIHLLKGNIGTGILAMPNAFKNSGIWVGTFSTLIIGYICVHTMNILVQCAHELSRRTQVPKMDFAQVAETAFRVGPPSLRRFSTVARTIVNAFLCITQVGFCCVYFLFVATNVDIIMQNQFGIHIDVKTYLVIILIPMILLNWLRNLKYLAPVSMIANVCMAAGLGIIFYYILQDIPPVDSRPSFSSLGKLPLYFGTAIYAFEGIGMVLPLENSMKNPHDFGGFCGVLNVSMFIVAILYTSVGFFGYLKYGDNIAGSITLNLPKHWLAELVRIMMAISIFFSYALQFYVPIDIMWPSLKSRLASERMQWIMELTFRSFLVFLTFILAELIPDLSLFIALVGAVSSSTLALIFPPIISILTNWATGYGSYRWILVKNLGLILFGMIGFLAGSYVSIRDILNVNSTNSE